MAPLIINKTFLKNTHSQTNKVTFTKYLFRKFVLFTDKLCFKVGITQKRFRALKH